MSNPENHVCVLCDSKLNSKEELQEHFRKHANKKIDLRGRELNSRGEVVTDIPHRREYIKGTGSQVGTNIVCDICNEHFTCNTRAIQHMYRKHPYNSAKHYCPQCGMQFPLKAHRDKHLAEEHESDHVPRNPYPCFQCGYVFYNKRAHEYHDKSAHHRVVTFYKQIQTPPPTKKIKYNNAGEPLSVYYCHLCGMEYIVKFNLQKHLERQHPPEERNNTPAEMFKCNTCEGLFYNNKAYQCHNLYHRPDDLYVTSEEQRLLTISRVDQDFDIRRIQPNVERYIPRLRKRRGFQKRVEIPTFTKPPEDGELSPPPNDESDHNDEEEKGKNFENSNDEIDKSERNNINDDEIRNNQRIKNIDDTNDDIIGNHNSEINLEKERNEINNEENLHHKPEPKKARSEKKKWEIKTSSTVDDFNIKEENKESITQNQTKNKTQSRKRRIGILRKNT